MAKINILGTIKRNCELCGEQTVCNNFEKEGKQHLMCNNCMYEKYGHGRKTQESEKWTDFDKCDKCDLLTMRLNKDLTNITSTQVIKHFQCDKCGHRKKSKIKRGKK